MMRGVVSKKFIILLLFLSACIPLCSPAASDDSDNLLEKASVEGVIPVIVVLKENAYERKIKFSKSRDKILSGLAGEEFRLKHKYSTVNGFSGEVTREGLVKLLGDPGVEGVYLDREVHAFLQQSVPLINATEVWGLQFKGENITGGGESICIIDTGVDYTHPDLGGCTIKEIVYHGSAGNLTTPVETPHPYPNNNVLGYEIALSNASLTGDEISIHFKNISTESNFDYVRVYDGNKTLLAVYSGSKTDIWTPPGSGDRVYVVLDSDPFVNGYGFYIDQVINGSVNITANWSNCSKVVYGWDVVNSDPDPMDDNGHGTHCAGIAAANGSIKGVAPDVKIIAVKVLDSDGNGYDSDVVAGIEFCVNISGIYNITVISMSLGGGLYSSYCDSSDPYMSSVINSAVARNISVVIASGNDNSASGIASPACIRNATPVGSSDDGSGGTTADVISPFTNRGGGFPELLLAPGRWITSSVPGDYATWSGTSMATPHVAGVVALMGQYLRLTGQGKAPDEMEKLLNNTGKGVYDGGTGLYFSRVDAYDAVMALNAAPAVMLYKPGNNSYVDGNFSILNWTCTDPEGNNLTAFVYGDNESADTLLDTVNCSGNTSCVYNWTGLDESVYYWRIGCNDSIQAATSGVWNFRVDLAAPAVSFLPPTPGDNARVDYNTVTINVSHVEKNPGTLILNLSGVPEYYNYSGGYTSIARTLANGFYTYRIWLNDTLGKWNQTGIRNLTVNATPPDVTLILPGNGSYDSDGNVTFTCNATDNVQLGNITLYWNYSIWNANGTNQVAGALNQTSFTRNSLQDGYYMWNCRACDNSSNCAFSPGNYTVTVDTVKPDITAYSINPKIVINGSNISLSVNATDLNVDETWAVIELPDSSQTTRSLPADYAVNRTGRHNITFLANDSAGNEVNVSDYFISSQGMQFNTSTVDYNNSGLNVTLRAYFNRSLIAWNQSTGSIVLTIADYAFDLDYSSFNNSLIVLFRGINLSENNNRTVGFDRLNAPGYLITYTINNSYELENASLNLSYSGTGYGNKNYVGLYRCASWDFPGRSCYGSWANIADAVNDVVDERFSLDVSNFSGFSVKQEPYCGDGIINNGESCDGSDFGGNTCSGYGFDYGSLSCINCVISTGGCGYRSVGSPGGGGSGGGGFGSKPKPSCFDGIMNCHDGSCETDVDCGGSCNPCTSCLDGIQNQGEEGIDCGGSCQPCAVITTATIPSTTAFTFITTTTIASTATTRVTVTSTFPATTTTTPKVSGTVDPVQVAVVFAEITLIAALYIRYKRHVRGEERREGDRLKKEIVGEKG